MVTRDIKRFLCNIYFYTPNVRGRTEENKIKLFLQLLRSTTYDRMTMESTAEEFTAKICIYFVLMYVAIAVCNTQTTKNP